MFEEEKYRSQRFGNILLEPVQKSLLIQLAEIVKSIPRNKLQKFIVTRTDQGDFIHCPNQKRFDAYIGDVEALGREGLIALAQDSKTFDVTPLGFAYCDYLNDTGQIKEMSPELQNNRKTKQDNESQDKTNEQRGQQNKDKERERERASIAGHSISDQATAIDKLGFEPYVNAVAQFLMHKDTKPPITMSIEGEWGTGKSSFMLQLNNELTKRGELTVSFSPWRHDKEDSLWAAFVLSFIEQIQRSTNWFYRIFKNVGLAFSRFDWRQGWPEALKVLLRWIAYISLVIGALIIVNQTNIAFLDGSTTKLIAKILGISILFWKLLNEVKDIVGNPLKHELNKYTSKLDYGSRICFAEKFHKDFGNIVNAYAGKRRVYVFVDDLDRCEVPKAADLMKAINLMISDDPALFFILGMDRIKVAAGLAVKDESLIPYISALQSSRQIAEDGSRDVMSGIIYGIDFIEKFIQVPFHIPRANPTKLQEMLNINTQKNLKISANHIMESDSQTSKREQSNEFPENKSDTLEEKAKKEQLRSNVGLCLGTDCDRIKSIINMVSKALACNPRRIKQFVNLLRLRAYIAFETGILKYLGRTDNGGLVTLEQLGKITAITIQWPLLLKAAIEKKDLLHMIACVAEGRKGAMDTSPIREWEGNEKLMELVRANCQDDPRVHSLDGVDIDKLLEVLPRTATVIPVELEEEINRRDEHEKTGMMGKDFEVGQETGDSVSNKRAQYLTEIREKEN